MEADFSYTSDRHVGDRWLKIGDAGAVVDPIFSSGVFLSTKAAEMAAHAIARAFAAGDFREAMFAEYEKMVRRGTKVFWAFIDAFYNRDFLKQMVSSRRRPLLQKSITSLLAGDIFNESNALITYLTGDCGAFRPNAAELLHRRLRVPRVAQYRRLTSRADHPCPASIQYCESRYRQGCSLTAACYRV
jgi:flavin-dependent dehydrogenase